MAGDGDLLFPFRMCAKSVGDVGLLLPLTGEQWGAPLNILFVLLQDVTSLSLPNGSSNKSKCFNILLVAGVLFVDVEYVVVTGALNPNTTGSSCWWFFLLMISGLCGGLPLHFLGDLWWIF